MGVARQGMDKNSDAPTRKPIKRSRGKDGSGQDPRLFDGFARCTVFALACNVSRHTHPTMGMVRQGMDKNPIAQQP
jgi:hypothetical protein